jgi:drug/metabolite transporter (DMT)-like permease
MTTDKRIRAVLLLIAAAVLWSLAGVLIKWVSLSGMAVAGIRSAIALPVLIAFFGMKAVNRSPYQLLGAVCYAATVILFACATKLTTAGNAILLQYTAPVYVAMLSGWLLKENIRWFDWVAIAVTLCGMGLFFLDQLSAGGMMGNIMAIASGISFAAMIVCMRKQKDASPSGSAIMGNALTALVCLPWMIDSSPGVMDWTGLLLLGVFQLGLSYTCYTIAIKNVSALEGILIPVLEPILNPLWALIFMGETVGPWALLGGTVVILSIVIRSVVQYGKT